MLRLALVLTVGLAAAACRQPDGQIPTPNDTQRNEIGDIGRDMLNITQKDPQAPADLAQDIEKYSTSPEATARSNELARRLGAALQGSKLDEPSAQRLAHTLWIALSARGLSQRQVQTLQDDVKSILAAASAASDRVQPVADQVAEVNRGISTNPKRWYQVF
jgi:hypothetical protein